MAYAPGGSLAGSYGFPVTMSSGTGSPSNGSTANLGGTEDGSYVPPTDDQMAHYTAENYHMAQNYPLGVWMGMVEQEGMLGQSGHPHQPVPDHTHGQQAWVPAGNQVDREL